MIHRQNITKQVDELNCEFSIKLKLACFRFAGEPLSRDKPQDKMEAALLVVRSKNQKKSFYIIQ